MSIDDTRSGLPTQVGAYSSTTSRAGFGAFLWPGLGPWRLPGLASAAVNDPTATTATRAATAIRRNALGRIGGTSTIDSPDKTRFDGPGDDSCSECRNPGTP